MAGWVGQDEGSSSLPVQRIATLTTLQAQLGCPSQRCRMKRSRREGGVEAQRGFPHPLRVSSLEVPPNMIPIRPTIVSELRVPASGTLLSSSGLAVFSRCLARFNVHACSAT
jgi:hypothetical protein